MLFQSCSQKFQFVGAGIFSAMPQKQIDNSHTFNFERTFQLSVNNSLADQKISKFLFCCPNNMTIPLYSIIVVTRFVIVLYEVYQHSSFGDGISSFVENFLYHAIMRSSDYILENTKKILWSNLNSMSYCW